MTVHGRYTGILRDDFGYYADDLYQGEPGVDFTSGDLYRANLSRRACDTDLDPLTTQVMLSVALYLRAGDVVTNLTFKSGATAADTPTNWWFALYDTEGALLAQTADQTTTAWAANTVKTLALSSAQTIEETGVHYAGIMVKATDLPSLVGASLGIAGASAGWFTGEKIIAQTSGSSLTTTAPATIATPTAVVNVPRVVAT
ncbi:hypothetical protein FH608_046100 [Nonomuraea phyllanthi]|uniref:Uncharacterized protein n=1 Tax=Nonomuraea phyllanthi TaxID=2219224 RepID=A0A5C4V5V0_9ACTN|nr:hypothetical protein [Nonomuraea phyllanthi]KAB8186869.1 hypothetical protein FH608_046100 [Nonomuraea phyllanthi]